VIEIHPHPNNPCFLSFSLQHVIQERPADHEMITNPNTTSFPVDWQSVAHAQMQATAEHMANSQDVGRVQISPMVYEKAHSSDTPRFFAWNGVVEEEVEKRKLTFENSHSEYRDLYDEKKTYQKVTLGSLIRQPYSQHNINNSVCLIDCHL
jgi:hypothetical protein